MIQLVKKLFEPLDLSKGSIWKVILWFSVPILLSYLFQQVYTIADAAICGQFLNSNQVAGVNNTGNIVFIVLQFAFGCTAGFSVVTANRIGKKDMAGVKQSLAVQILLCLLISVILTIVACLCVNPLLALIGLKPSENPVQNEIYQSAYRYVFIIFIGTAAQIYYNLICSFLRSIGDSLTPLLFLIFSTLLNIVLDLLFIAGWKMGVEGAAIATVIAQAVSAVPCFVYTFYRYKEYRLGLNDFSWQTKAVLKHLKLGLPLAFQFSILAIGLIVVQAVIVQFDTSLSGEVVVSYAQNGFGAATKLNNFLMCPFNALGTAMLSFCGQNAGANQTKRIKKGVTQALLIVLVEYVVFAGVGLLLTLNGFYLYIFYSPDKINAQTIHYGNIYLYCDLGLYFILGFLFVFRNALQGVGRALFPFLAGIGELVGRIAVCLILPTAINGGPISTEAKPEALIGLAFADPLAWLFAVLLMLYGVVFYIYKRKDTPLKY